MVTQAKSFKSFKSFFKVLKVLKVLASCNIDSLNLIASQKPCIDFTLKHRYRHKFQESVFTVNMV